MAILHFIQIRIETIEGSAEANKDFIPIKEMLHFEVGELLKQVDIGIVDDNVWEPDEVFFVKLSLDPDDPNTNDVVLGKKAIQEITIVNDDGSYVCLHSLIYRGIYFYIFIYYLFIGVFIYFYLFIYHLCIIMMFYSTAS